MFEQTDDTEISREIGRTTAPNKTFSPLWRTSPISKMLRKIETAVAVSRKTVFSGTILRRPNTTDGGLFVKSRNRVASECPRPDREPKERSGSENDVRRTALNPRETSRRPNDCFDFRLWTRVFAIFHVTRYSLYARQEGPFKSGRSRGTFNSGGTRPMPFCLLFM